MVDYLLRVSLETKGSEREVDIVVVVSYIGLANDLRLCNFQYMVAGPDRRDFAHKSCETFHFVVCFPATEL